MREVVLLLYLCLGVLPMFAQPFRIATWQVQGWPPVKGVTQVSAADMARFFFRQDALVPTPRAVPLPGGPVERYSDRVAIGSLGAFSVVLGVTRNPRRAHSWMASSPECLVAL